MIQMRWLMFAFVTLLAQAGRGEAQNKAEAIVDKAIQAQGGTTALERARVVSRTSSGMVTQNGMKISFTSELTMALPDRYRLSIKLGPQKTEVLCVINRDKGWEVNGGITIEMTPDRLSEQREEGYVVYLSTLAPLRREKGMTLELMPEEKIQGKVFDVVKAKLKGHDDVLLYFDKTTNMLARMSRKTVFAGLTAEKEYLFDEYKEFNGARLPVHMREMLNGRENVDHKASGYRFPSRVDDEDFKKP